MNYQSSALMYWKQKIIFSVIFLVPCFRKADLFYLILFFSDFNCGCFFNCTFDWKILVLLYMCLCVCVCVCVCVCLCVVIERRSPCHNPELEIEEQIDTI